MKIKTLSVTELNNYIKKNMDNDFILNNLSVKGEISNLKYHSSGHIYFSIKDSGGRINCVLFKMNALKVKFRLEEGMSVVIYGRASIYPQTGSLQIYCDDVEKEGLGDLYKKFEALKEKLSNEGLFDNENKKDIPSYATRVGVVTSLTGAAIQDIINVTKRRNKFIDLVLYPAKVQGEGGEREIIEGIKYFNKTKSVDVIIIGRGGGSMEDLWNFNEEILAKEIFKSKLPIISAVGHEIDFTISDFVSDYRAATPSQGAEVAVPLQSEIIGAIDYAKSNMDKIITNRFREERDNLDSFTKFLNLNSPKKRIENEFILVDKLKDKIEGIIKNKLILEKEKLSGLNNLLVAKNPCNILKKGYAIIEGETGVINSINMLSKEEKVQITLSDGKIEGIFSPKI